MGLRRQSCWMLMLTCFGVSVSAAARSVSAPPTAVDLWRQLQPTLPPLSYTVIRDEIVPSDTRRGTMLRRVELRFVSQFVGGVSRPMHHTAVIYVPIEPESRFSAQRGKVVVIGQRWGDRTILHNFGEPIAASTGFPTMVLPVPGEYDECDGESCWVYYLASELRRTGDPLYHNYVRLAVPYLRALDIFARILGVEDVRAVVGGHSKRATAAYTAAAMDPQRVVGVVYMGNESTWDSLRPDDPSALVAPTRTQATVRAPVLYVGATNEGGYQMFNINRIVGQMRTPWTIDYIPNHRHSVDSEIQSIAWQMWVAHIHDNRPLSRIVRTTHEDVAEGTVFRAQVESPNTIVHVKAWYTYTDNPYWQDLVWYPVDLTRKGDVYEGFLEGLLPDAWLVEVKDLAGGVPGYVTTLPLDLTGKPTQRRSGGGLPRLWRVKAGTLEAPARPSDSVPPAARWARLRDTLPPITFEQPGEVPRPGARGLRRVDVRFRSQTIGRFRRQMDHTATIFVPRSTAARASEALILGARHRDMEARRSTAARLAAESGRATMVVAVPGEYDGHDGENCWMYFLRTEVRDTGDPADHPDFRLAVVYLRALDVLAEIVDTARIRAVVGGEGQRATAALAAAAMDPLRIAGVVFGSYDEAGSDPLDIADEPDAWSPFESAERITAPVLELQSAQINPAYRALVAYVRRSVTGRWTVATVEGSGSIRDRAVVDHWRRWANLVFDGRRSAAKGAGR